jgi:serine/threonine protein kinase
MTDDVHFWVGPLHAPDTYQLTTVLGGGGEGDVWKAILPLSDAGRRQVAIKILRGTGTKEEEADWSRFGHLLQSLAHPGLVRVTDVFTGGGLHRSGQPPAPGDFRFVVMDFVEGSTLRDWTDENPDASAAARLALLRMVASALDEMHSGATTEIPVAHGDVKPANIVVRPDGGTVLVDLGLARLTDSSGVAGRSNPYAAPELRTAYAQSTPEADAYAFAVTAAQVLTGTSPPTDTSGFLDVAALQQLLDTSPTIQRRPMLASQILAVLSAAPEDRPHLLRPWLDNAADTLSQVTTLADGSLKAPAAVTLLGPGATSVAGALPSTHKRRTAAIVVAVVLAVLLVAAGSVYALTGGSSTKDAIALAGTSSTPTIEATPTETTATDTATATSTDSATTPSDAMSAGTPSTATSSPTSTGVDALPATTQWIADTPSVATGNGGGAGQTETGAYKSNGVIYPHSLAMRSGCFNSDGGDVWIEYDLSRSWSTLTGHIGLTDDSPTGSAATWKIFGDGKLIASGKGTVGKNANLKVSVGNVLRLRVLMNDPATAVRTCNMDPTPQVAFGDLQLTA